MMKYISAIGVFTKKQTLISQQRMIDKWLIVLFGSAPF